MADETADFTREYLRRMDAKLDRVIEIALDMRDRVSSLEKQTALIRDDLVRLDHRIDSLDNRIARIEKRLDLIDA